MELFPQLGATELAQRLGMTERGVYGRRRRLEKVYDCSIPTPKDILQVALEKTPQRLQFKITEGMIPIGSDAHIWPGPLTTAQRAFLKFCEKFKDQIPMVILNGDVVDGAKISRFPSIGWEDKPTIKEEILAVKEYLNQVEAILPDAIKVWPLGNHDARFETRLANQVPEFEGVHGFHLKDFYSEWLPCWSCFINDDIVVKHRFKGGIHATHNNTLWSGRNIVTGHLHSLKVTPFSDYNGARYGVDCGTLADPMGQQFADYLEDNPVNWRSGFAVLTVAGSKLMMPELVQVWDDTHVQFRGQLFEV